jgi:hypothetical protein
MKKVFYHADFLRWAGGSLVPFGAGLCWTRSWGHFTGALMTNG